MQTEEPVVAAVVHFKPLPHGGGHWLWPFGHRQDPFWQVCPPVQGWLQPPQLLVSDWILTQALPQVVGFDVGHPQVPGAVQIPSFKQGLLQVPQLAGSVAVFVQTVLEPVQSEFGAPQLQLPAVHVSLAAHFVPHPPQLFGSLATFTQLPEHRVPPFVHVHLPATHGPLNVLHEFSQAPQLLASFVVSTQAPWALQSDNGAVQPQRPLLHLLPSAVSEHDVPHVPQFELSDCKSTQLLSQQPLPVAHTLPQAPQFAESEVVETHLPPHVVSLQPGTFV